MSGPRLRGQKNRFLLVYGSATGQAQAIADEIAEKAPNFGLYADLHTLDATGKRFNVENEKCMVVVTSTTGDGDPPENAEKFLRRIRKRTLGRDYLSHLHYAMLGLGDSNYSNFCRCARDMDSRLEALGAQRFYPTGLADDGVGLEVVADPWLEGLYPALQKFLGVTPTNEASLTETVQSLNLSDTEKQENGINSMETDKVDGCDFSQNAVISDDAIVAEESGPNEKNGNVTSTSEQGDENSTVIKSGSTLATDLSRSSQDSTTPPADNNCNCNLNDSAYNSDNSVKDSPSESSQRNTNAETSPHTDKENGPSPTSYVSTTDISSSSINGTDSSRPPASVINSESLTSQNQFSLKYPETPCVPITTGSSSSVANINGPSLTKSQPPLSEQALTVPVLPPPFLSAEFSSIEMASLSHQNGCKLPSAASEIFHVPVSSAKVLTAPDAVKKTLLLRLNIQGTDFKYSPGDSISIICPNNSSEVELLLNRLDVTQKANATVTLSVIPDTKKRRAAVPPHVHPTSTLRHIFTTCLNIRESPSKAFIRALIEHTTDPTEVRRMQELCSKDGASEYTHYIRESHISFLDFLFAFPSCKPPVERVIEHLPRLQPRPYSACSCQEMCPDSLDIVFNVVEIAAEKDKGHYYSRRGVCTGWLDDVTSSLQTGKDTEKIEIPIFLRTNQHFRPPEDLSKPMIMIGPGTGVAPFVGFLQKRALQKSQLKDGEDYGETWLFYGCRNKDKDYLFREELEKFETDNILTKLCVAFSRDPQPSELSADDPNSQPARYVQDLMRRLSSELCRLLVDAEALIFVCGDAKNMAKDVNAAFEEILQNEKGMSQDDAHMFMMKKRINKTYFEDVWV